jgi:CheY-like chemotaxis protein
MGRGALGSSPALAFPERTPNASVEAFQEETAMATILLVEDAATVSGQVTRLLEAAGHQVVRCGGGPTPLAACLLLRHGRCPLVDNADLVVFACPLALPLPSRSYRGIHLLHAYRAHPDYGRLPLVLVAVAPPHNLAGAGPIEVVATHTDPAAVVAAVNRLLQPTGAGTGSTLADHDDDLCRAAAG